MPGTAAKEATPSSMSGSAGLVSGEATSPIGRLKLVASSAGLVALLWPNDRPMRVPLGSVAADKRDNDHIRRARDQLAAYFDGRSRRFDVALDLRGTLFQREVWAELAKIPRGETRSYGAVAIAVGRPTGARAVGAAVGRNPISIIVPCHRVIGTGGNLTGFAGGLDAKRQLLALESAEGHLL